MKKKIANAVQIVLLIASFIVLNLKSITVPSNNIWGEPYNISAIYYLKDFSAMLIPIYVLYALCAVMCIISIISKSKYKDGKAHGAVAILLFIYSMFAIFFFQSSDYDFAILESNFPAGLFIGLLFAVVVVAFAKRSSFIADTKETQQTVVNNIQETTNADELKKYKDLLDSGAITQEEFENKKKELLGL